MSKADEPAFPVADGPYNSPVGGLSKRELLAGMAMQGMMARDSYDPGQATPQQRAQLACIEADALLAELAKAEG